VVVALCWVETRRTFAQTAREVFSRRQGGALDRPIESATELMHDAYHFKTDHDLGGATDPDEARAEQTSSPRARASANDAIGFASYFEVSQRREPARPSRRPPRTHIEIGSNDVER
jgi:hypothetical protein